MLQQVCRCFCLYGWQVKLLQQGQGSCWIMLLEGCLCLYGRQGCILQQIGFKRLLL